MTSKAEEVRAKVLRWLSYNRQGGVYEMWQDTRIHLFRLYPLLTALEQEGLVTRTESKRKKRVLYKLTAKGEQAALDAPPL